MKESVAETNVKLLAEKLAASIRKRFGVETCVDVLPETGLFAVTVEPGLDMAVLSMTRIWAAGFLEAFFLILKEKYGQ
jgi:hypothetical protein